METNVVKRFETVIPTTKQGIQKLAVDIIQQLDNGDISGLELLKNFKMIEKLQEIVKEKMIKTALIEADKYKEKDVAAYGVTFTKMEAGVKYDYSGCGDETYLRLLKAEEELKAEKKKREDLLKAIDGHIVTEVVDEDTGEVVNAKLYPPVKTSTTTLQVKIS